LLGRARWRSERLGGFGIGRRRLLGLRVGVDLGLGLRIWKKGVGDDTVST